MTLQLPHTTKDDVILLPRTRGSASDVEIAVAPHKTPQAELDFVTASWHPTLANTVVWEYDGALAAGLYDMWSREPGSVRVRYHGTIRFF